MEPGRMQPVAIVKRSRQFVENQMHLFIGKLMRGRVAGNATGKPVLNFGSFAIPFESELILQDGEIATFRVINLSKNTITLGFVRREGTPVTTENIDVKIKALLNELRLPVDREHTQAAKGLLKAGFAASRENIRATVTLKTDPGGEGTASRLLRGLLLDGADVPPKILTSLREYIAALSASDPRPESAWNKPSPVDMKNLAAKLAGIRGQDNTSVDLQVLTRRILDGLKPLTSGNPAEIAEGYRAAAGKRVGAEAALMRAFQVFAPKFISGMHPDDPLRVIFEQFASAVKGFTASQAPAASTASMIPITSQPLPLEIVPAFIEYILGQASTSEGAKDMLAAFAKYIQQVITPTSTDAPTGSGAKELQGNAGLNIGRLIAMIGENLSGAESSADRNILNTLLDIASTLAPRAEGARIGEWLMTPGRPGAENLPVVGFMLDDKTRGSLSLHPGVRQREDGEEEVPAGGRMVYEGEGIGKLEIGLEYGGDGLSVIFLTERKDAHEDIQSGLPGLSERLNARGIQVKSLRSVLRVSKAEADDGAMTTQDDLINGGLDVKA